ncbi:AmmeMemoRadiSam system radical SAM enzyme [bacterium]|nr:AmmeMemoRadiSam system radical SAM enzyme [bacterium]
MKNAETSFPARWWRVQEDGRIECELCPRRCRLREGQRGFCFVRQNEGGRLVLTTYGRSSGFCIDPIEKKPLNQFYPGSAVLSFGTAGCNLGCRFCQNWDISKARQMDRLADQASPEAIARAAQERGCRSVAFTYNDPVIFAEYALDTAAACHELGVKTVAVTAGYIEPPARAEFFAGMDAANVDLKAFTEEFYKEQCFAELAPVLETLEFIHRETSTWMEITTLLIPGLNDSEAELHRLTEWVAERLGPDVPLHFTAFHPDFKVTELPPTPAAKLQQARRIGLGKGLHYVYTGNVHDPEGANTYCPKCGKVVIERNWYDLGAYHIRDGKCEFCGQTIAGRFGEGAESWGTRMTPVRMS